MTVCAQNIDHCISLKRIISLLKYYNNNHQNYNGIEQYLEKYSSHLIEDYHHILDKHLNEDKISKLECNKQFEMIYNEITNKHNISCDITNCKIYSRNNREREILNIDGINDCYFLHSVDTGYRIIQKLIDNKVEEQTNGDKGDNYNECDMKMKQLQLHFSQRREKLQKIRGHRRINNTKFMTHISS